MGGRKEKRQPTGDHLKVAVYHKQMCSLVYYGLHEFDDFILFIRICAPGCNSYIPVIKMEVVIRIR